MRTLIIGSLLLLVSGGSAAAFDCQNPKNPAVAVVCSDPELIRLTGERKRAWEEARAHTKGKERSALIADQRRWLREYPASCGVAATGEPPATIDKSAQECFKRANSQRIAYLRAAASPAAPATEEAAKSPEATKPAQAKAAEPAEPSEAAKPPEPSKPVATAKPPEPAKPVAAEKPAEPARPPAAAKASATSATDARWHLKFTFACQTPDKLAKVLSALGNNDIGYALNQTDCLPVPEGRDAILLSVAGKLAKIRLCSSDAGCTDVYADAAMVLDPAGNPVGK
jgi:uncharacterized protein